MTDLEFKNLLHDLKCILSHLCVLADYDQLEVLEHYLSERRMYFAEIITQHYHDEFKEKE